jgi:putative transcriptional regulator
VTVSHLFPDLVRLAQLDDKVYFGGPVQLGTVTFLFRADAAPDDATRVIGGVYASTDAKLLRKLLERDKPMEGLRIFVGYSGWGPGQLENEIARGDWTLAPVDADALFGRKHEHPWPAPQGSEAQRT